MIVAAYVNWVYALLIGGVIGMGMGFALWEVLNHR